ncbi:MAG TPA: hypothetical protein VI546_00565 [candidate division Zixibacteria bacterium]|nr:hypothetical protein [candidate division Zixibacteria bacterium]
MKHRPIVAIPIIMAFIGCNGDPRLSVNNTYSATVFYEITIAGDQSAYLAGHMIGKESKSLTLQTGKNLLIFVQPDTTGNQQNFITLDSLLAEKGKKYLLELNPQYVSGHQHGNPRIVPPGPVEFQSKRNPLR